LAEATVVEHGICISGDGIYLKAGIEKEKTALLCIVGARRWRKELLAMEPGYRESTKSWAEVLRT